MKRPIALTAIAAALLLGLDPVFGSASGRPAHPPNPPNRPNQNPNPRRELGGQMRPGGNQAPMQRGQAGMGMAELGLSDVQKADIRKVMESARRDRLRKSTDRKIASMDLKSLMRADKVDDKAVAAKLAEVQAAQGSLLKLRVDSALAMKRILTPEQQKKMMAMRGARRMNGPGAGFQRPGPTGPGRGRAGKGMGRGKGRGPMGGDFDLDDDDEDDDDDDDDARDNRGVIR